MRRVFTVIACSVAMLIFAATPVAAQEGEGAGGSGPQFVRGDVNADGTVDLSDSISLLNGLFRDAGSIPCQDAADANDDGEIDISDPIRIMLFLFQGGSANQIPAPSQTCGVDGSSDRLTCERYGPCETGGGSVVVVRGEIGGVPEWLD